MLDPPEAASAGEPLRSGTVVVGGGTDWFVRNPHPEPETDLSFSGRAAGFDRIERIGDRVLAGASVTVQAFFADPLVREIAPGIERYAADIASLPIRRRATVAGNVTNASPIGDLTIILLALGASVRVRSASGSAAEIRTLPLERFFLAYRQVDLREGELVEGFEIPAEPVRFSFEKVAKRSRLDIASVNSACAVRTDGTGTIVSIRLSAGGVAPVPLLLSGAMERLQGRRPDAESVNEAARTAAAEIRPIDDVRGSAEYRRELTDRLVRAHLTGLLGGNGAAREIPV